MWGVGGLVGPPLAGVAIDAFGINAMPYTLVTLYGLLLVAVLINRGELAKPLEETL
jgi:fucose permease